MRHTSTNARVGASLRALYMGGLAALTLLLHACGGSGSSVTPTTNNPQPVLTSTSPSSATAGGSAFELSVSGSSFVSGATVQWNGATLSTHYVSATQLTASVPASDITTAGAYSITVVNPTPGGGTSSASTFTVSAQTGPPNPTPVLSTVEPVSVSAGSSAFTITLDGSGFVSSSVVQWTATNGTVDTLTTTLVSSTQLTAVVTSKAIADATGSADGSTGNAGTAAISVVTPSPGGGTSGSVNFTINQGANIVPGISSLSPATATAGANGFTLTVGGSNFLASSYIRWNGQQLTTSYVNANTLTASVPASLVSTAGSQPIYVVNPGSQGGTSTPLFFTILPQSTQTGGTPTILQSGTYMAFTESGGGAISSTWTVTLNNVQQGSTLYVVGIWPGPGGNNYPSMAVTDVGSDASNNSYVFLDRYDDGTTLNSGIKGTQSMGHWYRANVNAGSYTITMSPNPQTWEDYAAIVVFEVGNVSSTSPLVAHAISFQSQVAPGQNALSVGANNTVANSLAIATTFDDVDFTGPTTPLVGSGYTDAGTLWDFYLNGNFSGRAETKVLTSTGAFTATFTPQEGPDYSGDLPDYMTTVAVFH